MHRTYGSLKSRPPLLQSGEEYGPNTHLADRLRVHRSGRDLLPTRPSRPGGLSIADWRIAGELNRFKRSGRGSGFGTIAPVDGKAREPTLVPGTTRARCHSDPSRSRPRTSGALRPAAPTSLRPSAIVRRPFGRPSTQTRGGQARCLPYTSSWDT